MGFLRAIIGVRPKRLRHYALIVHGSIAGSAQQPLYRAL